MTNPIPIFDGHNDTLLRLHRASPEKKLSFFVDSGDGHLDLPRALQGGLGGGFFAIFTPSPNDKPADYPGTSQTSNRFFLNQLQKLNESKSKQIFSFYRSRYNEKIPSANTFSTKSH